MARPIFWNEKRIGILCASIRTYVRECYVRDVTVDGAGRNLAPKLPSIEEFLSRSRSNSNYIYELAKTWPKLSETIKKLRDVQRMILINMGLLGAYSSTPFIFTAKNILHWKDDPFLIDQSSHTHYTIQNLAKEANGINGRIKDAAQKSLSEPAFILGESLKRDSMDETNGNHGSVEGQPEGNGKKL